MKIIVNEQQYVVNFRHTQEEDIRNTECKILQPINGKEMLGYISIGYSRCHPKDNFEKEKGRQLALKKALEDGEFTKEARTIFWQAYKYFGVEKPHTRF